MIDLEPWSNRCTFPAPGTALRCGVSGGADSLALLALASYALCDVTAVHVDHGQRPGGEAEAANVAARAAEVGARFEAVTVDVSPGPNLEARMRSARYVALGPDAATGHSADDQAETVLINLIRGAGMVGLGAMQPGHRRPILALRRSDTEAVCAHLGWRPFTDPSNAEARFLRNRVRHEVLPLLDDVANRDVVPLLVRSADHAREAADLLDERVDQIDPTDAKALSEAPRSIAARAIQRWVRAQTGDDHPIDAAAIARVLEVAAGATIAAEVHGGWRVSRSQQRLSISAIVESG